MIPKIRVAVRDWDYLTPLALGDISPDKFELELHRVTTLSGDLASSPDYDAGEVSFSRYAQSVALNDCSLLAIPHFLMRGFRQRCIITTKNSPLNRLEQLAGKRIGLTGWQDSGNTWTRALLREIGIKIEDVGWFVGRLTAEHPIEDRLGGFGRPGCIEAAPDERPLIELLEAGELDAIFTAFMPDGFFAADSNLRQLQVDFCQAESDYFKRLGYVPGIHLLAFKPAVVEAYPWLPAALSEVIDHSAQMWLEKRIKYADTTPWLLNELRRTAQLLPANWNQNGYRANLPMIDAFAEELYHQGITKRRLLPAELFPFCQSIQE